MPDVVDDAVSALFRWVRFVAAIVLAVAAAGALTAPLRAEAAGSYGVAPPFTLPDVEGGSFTMPDHRRRVVVLAFVAADCRDACPLIEGQLRRLAETLARQHRLERDVAIVTVEIDPLANSAERVHSLRRKLWTSPGWFFLRGAPAETQRLLAAYDIRTLPRVPGKDLEHATWVYVIDRRGNERELLAPGVNLSPERLLQAVAASQ